MKDVKKSRIKEILTLIDKDMKEDATTFESRPFNGKTVGTYFGYHGAAIAALAILLKEILEDNDD